MSLIVNSPYTAPTHYWRDKGGALQLVAGRRPAAYDIFDTRNNTRRSEPLVLVEKIRERVEAWRAAAYPGVTSVTRSLLEHWQDRGARDYPFYFCQIEAIETLIWWVEAPADYKQGIFVPGDGGPWERLCSKMATGSGKTLVMGMLATWQILNALTYPKRRQDFSASIFVVAPGLTVKDRLGVLLPGRPDNVYDAFNLCPSDALRQRLNQGRIRVENWHVLMPLRETVRSVVKKGPESDRAFVKRVLGELADARDLIVFNDEAHHAYRLPADVKIGRKRAEEEGIDTEQATRWVEGLDRIHKVLRLRRCFDLSATPFAPTGKTNSEEGLYGWIVSDYGLNDAIEAGLVKTPRVVVRDGLIPDTKTLRPKLYHLYREPSVRDDLNRRGAQPHEALPLLVQQAFTLLGADWRVAAQSWADTGHVTPPVLLTVCNKTETAARVEHYLRNDVYWPELRRSERVLRVDSRVLEKIERGESGKTEKDYDAHLQAIITAAQLPQDVKARLLALKGDELLRALVDSVGKRGGAGQELQAVVSVAMLSEGWDAKNVTHILGLRAFTSQLLCEQVIGRGLRRVSHETETVTGPDGEPRELFRPEYVNVFGVPLSIFVDDTGEGEKPDPPKATTQIESLPERVALAMTWPNVLRVDRDVSRTLTVNWDVVETLVLDPTQTVVSAELAPVLGGAQNWAQIEKIDLESLPEEFRLQRLVFNAARKAQEDLQGRFTGTREYLLFQLVRLVEQFLASKRIEVPSLFHSDPLRRRILMALNLDRIVQHLLRYVDEASQQRLEPVFDPEFPIGSTAQMRTWYTSKPCQPTQKSQISHVAVDSAWEGFVASGLEASAQVLSYARNERLGFQIYYLWNGARRRYIPDFLVRLANGRTLVLEIKGRDTDQDRAKRAALKIWVEAINARGGFGLWCSDVLFEMAQLQDCLARHVEETAEASA